MKSMTGYGKGCAQADGKSVTIELKSVNNRFLEINARLPKSAVYCDSIVRKKITSAMSRGSVDVYFTYENKSIDYKNVNVDWTLAKAYMETAKLLRDEFCADYDFGVTALMRTPDVVKADSAEEDEDIIKMLTERSLAEALENLDLMRRREGQTIGDDLYKLLANLAEYLGQIVQLAPKAVEDYRIKILARMTDFLKDVSVDESRLLNEVAAFSDKCDVNEEISRLSSHLSQFKDILALCEPQGRKLDFLSQEINREINTLGSKSNQLEMTKIVVAMKNELEKMKEQIRNVE